MESSKTWSWIVFVVTIAYLVIEMSFSSELLNIVGQSASTADISSIEHWGRYISGFAAGLVFWSIITPSLYIPLLKWRPIRSIGRSLILNILVTAGVMVFVYHWEMNIVNHAKAKNSGIQRKEAVYAAFVRTGLLNGTVQLTGMPQAKAVYQTPEGKAFVALLPKLVDSENGLQNKLNGVLLNVIENNIRVKTGGAQGFFDHVFLPSATRMNGAWEKYRGMVAHLNAAYQRANNTSGYERHAIILNADNAFHTSFRNTFSVPGYPLADVNPAMVNSPSAFFALPVITRFWAHSIHAMGVTQPMFPNETYAAVRTNVWPVFLKKSVDRELHTFRSNAINFRNGQDYASQGRNAVVLLTVPALALILSVIGMLIHATKILYYMQKLAEKRKRGAWRRFFVALGISAVIAGTFYVMSDAITVAPLYRHLNSVYQQSGSGGWPGWMLTWIIQAEHFVYPVADFLRQYVLLGFHFGVASHA